MIGEEGILQELDLKGIRHLGGPSDGDKRVKLGPGEFMEHDEEVGQGVEGVALGVHIRRRAFE